MKNTFLPLFVFCLMIPPLLFAQDEGTIVKRERIPLDKGIFVGGGISVAGGSNFGDYSAGVNFEGGYLKRLNRVFSIGGSISYLSFKYDPSVIKNKPDIDGSGVFPNFYFDYLYYLKSSALYEGYVLTLEGGDISIASLALNLKVNFVPIKDNSVVSVYGFAKPFIASASSSELTGFGEYIYNDTINNVAGLYDPAKNIQRTYKSQSSITGGIFIGPGIEFFPSRAFSFFLQASFGYTFPINIVSTRSYGNDTTQDLGNPNFPVKSLGFTSINFAGGISYNLD